MLLNNPFPQEVRELFRGVWECWECGQNGTDTGGLEIHHITGRDSCSAFNASVLCKKCHEKKNHNHKEEQFLFFITQKFLKAIGYVPIVRDYQFISEHPYLVTPEYKMWLKNVV